MARNLCLNRKMEEAWRYTREADRLSKRYDFKNRSDIYNTYGEIALEAGDYMKAGLYYEQAIREHGFSQLRKAMLVILALCSGLLLVSIMAVLASRFA